MKKPPRRRSSIEIRSDLRGLPISLGRLKRLAARILKSLGYDRSSLSLYLTKDRVIRRLNRKYLRHDRSTDVMAFGASKRPVKREPFLGDIVISAETAKRKAKIHGTTYRYELCLYLCHGILHLIGHEDQTRPGAAMMQRKQRKFSRRFFPLGPRI
ncbi:MAG: rRNA maturation RNase YbeY [Candidatus Omnitrophota bacterium]